MNLSSNNSLPTAPNPTFCVGGGSFYVGNCLGKGSGRRPSKSLSQFLPHDLATVSPTPDPTRILNAVQENYCK